MTIMQPVQGDNVYPNQTCPGMDCDEDGSASTETSAVHAPVSSSKLMGRTSQEASSLSARPQMPQKEFRSPNGSGSSEVKHLIWTTSCLQSSALQSMKKSRHALERLNFLSVQRKLNERSDLLATGLPRGAGLQKHSPSHFPTDETNSTSTAPTYNVSSTQNNHLHTNASSRTISPSETTLEVAKPSSSLIERLSPTSIQPLSSRMGLSSLPTLTKDPLQPEPRSPTKPAGSSTPCLDVPTHHADTSTHAVNVEKRDTRAQTVQIERNEAGLQPKYLRYNLWTADQEHPMTIADWSETAVPLPRPPTSEINNPAIADTLSTHSHLFSVNTPIQTDHFELLLTDHPNKPFVTSVLTGLREGFWPWANTMNSGFPATHVQEPNGHYDDVHRDFFRAQLAHEQRCGRYSDSFGNSLLPGMYSMPIYAVPKPDSGAFHLVNDHSAGPFSVNSMIDHSCVTGYPLDNLHLLGTMLLNQRELLPGLDRVMWKSDISDAYRICPVHPLWQLKQAVNIDGEFYVDRACCFGSSASFAIFASVNSLIAWIAKRDRGIPAHITYVDDSSGPAMAGDVAFYERYDGFYPSPQVALLEL